MTRYVVKRSDTKEPLHVGDEREARIVAQRMANKLQVWTELHGTGEDAFVANFRPEHQCQHCGKWTP